MDNYTWILVVGVIVFFLVVAVLLCFTRANGDRLFLGADDVECGTNFEETPELLATLSEDARISFEQAKVFQQRYPPDSVATDITLSQFISIQEKGVSAFEFEWNMESSSFVSARTEIQFYSGESCVQTNLPLPRNQDVYYWEAKMFEKPMTTTVAVGVATKPYPSFRLPGWNKHSVAYFSDTGDKHFSNPFHGKPFGPPFKEGDVVGVGYRHRSGTVFFTRNGRRLEDACFGLRWNLFPTIGANGPCQIHVNLGQRGFVFVEANVKKWGLAPMRGTLAPPPAYGHEAGSLLLECGTATTSMAMRSNSLSQSGYQDEERQPLIRINIPPNSNARRLPQSPPEYSTFPRSPGMMPVRRAAQYDSGTDTEDNISISSSSSSSSSNSSSVNINDNDDTPHEACT